MTETPRFHAVRCLDATGFHTMRYAQWGDPTNPRAVICVHGLNRVGRDFDHLARALSARYRVVCPDLPGRGTSDWLRDPQGYGIEPTAADLVTLIARLDVETVAWVGTSFGGLIGIALAGLAQSPITRLVINDIGPHLEWTGLAQIGAHLGRDPRFASVEEAVAYQRTVSAGAAMRNDAEWREMTLSVLKRDGDGYVFHYDPAIAEVLRAMDPKALRAAEQQMWRRYDAIACPTLLLHGEKSDILGADTVAAMQRRGPRPQVVTVPGVGHAPMFFDSAQIAAVRDFLFAEAG